MTQARDTTDWNSWQPFLGTTVRSFVPTELSSYPDDTPEIMVQVSSALTTSVKSGLFNPEDQACQAIIQFVEKLFASGTT